MPRPLKILYITEKYDYGNLQRGFGYEHYNFYDTLVKMNAGQNQIIYFPIDEIMLNNGKEAMNKELEAAAFAEKPDLIFFINGGERIERDLIWKLTKDSGAITFNWFSDDHWKFHIYSRFWAPLYRWISTTDSKAIEKYRKIGYKNVVHTQWACNHFLYKKLDLPKIHDITFIGQPHSNRRKVVKKIEDAGINIKCWGKGWLAGRIGQDEMMKVFSQSKINLNLTLNSGASLKSIASMFLRRDENENIGFRNPKIWINNFKALLGSFGRQIKGRNFEIPGCGGFLLTDYADNLKDYYEPGKEIVVFDNQKDLIDKIKYYLAHDEEREAIAQAGYQRTLKDHTFEKRLNDIFSAIGLH